MIKLVRQAKPSILTPEKVKELTDKFKADKSSVWNISEIKESLLKSSNGKCAYCECFLTNESNYMEVEHFEDKNSYPDKVVDWDNLLPSCKKCNASKSTHDVNSEPIINPYIDEPTSHLAMRFYRLRGKTIKGNVTIEVTNLNDMQRSVPSRFEIGEKIHELLLTAKDRLVKYESDKTVRKRNRLYASIEGLLTECQPNASYAATTASILIGDVEFGSIRNAMIKFKIWTDEHELSYLKAKNLVLDGL